MSDAAQLTLFGSDTLAEARAMVETGRDDGITCPCCVQYAKTYRRKLNVTMARGLIWLARSTNMEPGWADMRRTGPRWLVAAGGEFAKVYHWGLAEQQENTDSAKRTSGIWRLTETGVDFVQGRIRVPSHCYLYNNKALHFSDTLTTIREALGKKFNYAELMGWHVE